jgi:hypothetical protein
MKFVWVPSIKRYRRTEGEVKKAKQHYEVLEIETDKDSLIDRFNAYEERIEALQQQIDGGGLPSPPAAVEQEAPSEAAPQPQVAPPATRTDEAEMKRRLAQSLRSMEREAIEDAILESKGAAFGAYLACSIARLGELGRDGWTEFAAFRNFCRDGERSQAKDKFKHLSTFDERGLRYLALMQVKDLDGEPIE